MVINVHNTFGVWIIQFLSVKIYIIEGKLESIDKEGIANFLTVVYFTLLSEKLVLKYVAELTLRALFHFNNYDHVCFQASSHQNGFSGDRNGKNLFFNWLKKNSFVFKENEKIEYNS